MVNAGTDAVDFHLPPPPPGCQWRLAVDTFVETPFDLLAPGEEPLLKYPQTYLLKPRSSAILLARKPDYADKRGSK
jgi:glycogen operon protein